MKNHAADPKIRSPQKIDFWADNPIWIHESIPTAWELKKNLRIITKNLVNDSEIGFRAKSILKSYGRTADMPIA